MYAARTAARVAGPSRASARRASTVAQQAQQHQSHIVAGVAGATAVIVAGYSWYRLSGTHAVVQSAREFQSSLKSVKDGAKDSMPDANAVLKMTRQGALAVRRRGF